MKHEILFEVCCGCAEDVINAAAGGADRVELNSALFLGGLTPSLGVLRRVKAETDIQVMAMVRPREGGFCYTAYDYETMLEDGRLLLEAGADGLVFGFLLEDGTVDEKRTAEFVKLCGGRSAVFHRAVDLCPDPVESARRLEALGVNRILTSGGQPTALMGAKTIRRMREALSSCEVLPGGGIKPETVGALLELTGVRQIHAAARSPRRDGSAAGNPSVFFGGKIDGKFLPEDTYQVTDQALVREMRRAINAASAGKGFKE